MYINILKMGLLYLYVCVCVCVSCAVHQLNLKDVCVSISCACMVWVCPPVVLIHTYVCTLFVLLALRYARRMVDV